MPPDLIEAMQNNTSVTDVTVRLHYFPKNKRNKKYIVKYILVLKHLCLCFDSTEPIVLYNYTVTLHMTATGLVSFVAFNIVFV